MVYDLTFSPTNLDVLYDQARDKYVQRIGGINSPTDDPAHFFTCIDLTTKDYIRYKIGQYDVIEDNKGLASKVLPEELKKQVHKIDERIEITGKILERS